MQGQFGNAAKITFLVSAGILMILGLVLCGFGAAKIVDFDQLLNEAFEKDEETTDEEITVQIPAAIIAGAGLITVLIVVLGCFGAFRENRVVLGVYIPLLLILFICICACVVVLYATRSEKVKEKLKDRIELYDKDSSNTKERTATDFVDSIQSTLKCCGFESYKDWEGNTYLSTQSKKVPESCCKHDDIDDPNACQVNPAAVEDKLVGCTSALNPFGKEVGVIAIVMVFFMLINLIATCVLCAMVD